MPKIKSLKEIIKVLGLEDKVDIRNLTQGEIIAILRAYYALKPDKA